jgi:glycosyltransferase involved in cell wall biosynthesis
MSQSWLTALPVFNEAKFVQSVLTEVRNYSNEILVVDDGSTDGTAELLTELDYIHVLTHEQNHGYGAALRSAFCYAIQHGIETIVTIDCDGQHEPQRIPELVEACQSADIVSGSRYLQQFPGDDAPPTDRQWINQQITDDLNRRLGLRLTDAFCGFKAYRVSALRKLRLTENGYAMPLELWVQASYHELKINEVPVPLIYLDEDRSFGGALDDETTRLDYYRRVLDLSIASAENTNAPPLAYACGEDKG